MHVAQILTALRKNIAYGTVRQIVNTKTQTKNLLDEKSSWLTSTVGEQFIALKHRA